MRRGARSIAVSNVYRECADAWIEGVGRGEDWDGRGGAYLCSSEAEHETWAETAGAVMG